MASASLVLIEDVERALAALNQKYITSLQRKNIVLLLKSSDSCNPNLISTFQKSTFKVPYLSRSVKDAVREVLLQLKSKALNESLEDLLQRLSLDREPSSSEVFASITNLGGTSLREPFWKHCQRAGAFQNAVYSNMGRIVILGTASAEDFWSELKKTMPSGVLESIISYFGDLDPPTISLELGGHSFPLEVVEDNALQEIPDRLPSTSGTIGGFIVVKREKQE